LHIHPTHSLPWTPVVVVPVTKLELKPPEYYILFDLQEEAE
jgi:hypothetical protein